LEKMDGQLTKLLQDLIRIDSQNPPGNETAIIAFIKNYLKTLGLDCRIYEFQKGRPNLVCCLKSKNSRRKLLFTPHIDTVPATGQWRYPPLAGTVSRGRIYGRGATDCKSNAAVALYLIKQLKEKNTRLDNLDLVFAFCADEETGSHYGTIPLMKKLRDIDYGVVLDADEFDIVIAQKGLLHLRVELRGKEAHGAYPERGVNAVEKGVRILNEILAKKFTPLEKNTAKEHNSLTGFIYKPHPILIKPTLNVGRFCGGDKVNIVAGYAFFELDIRWLPSMDRDKIIRGIESIIKKQKIPYKIKILSAQPPAEVNRDNIALKVLAATLAAHGIKPQLKASFGATVINFVQAAGAAAFAFGFGTKNCAHTKNEYVEIKNLQKGVDILEDYVRRLDEKV